MSTCLLVIEKRTADCCLFKTEIEILGQNDTFGKGWGWPGCLSPIPLDALNIKLIWMSDRATNTCRTAHDNAGEAVTLCIFISLWIKVAHLPHGFSILVPMGRLPPSNRSEKVLLQRRRWSKGRDVSRTERAFRFYVRRILAGIPSTGPPDHFHRAATRWIEKALPYHKISSPH